MNQVAVIAVAMLVGVVMLSAPSSAATYCYYAGNTEGVYSESGEGWGELNYWGSCEDLYIKWYGHVDNNGQLRTSRWVSGNCECFYGTSYAISYYNGDAEGIRHITGTDVSRGFLLKNMERYQDCGFTMIVSNASLTEYNVSGTTECVDDTLLYIYVSDEYTLLQSTSASSYSFSILDGYSYRLLFDDVYYDFTCSGGDVVFDYEACLWVYGYTCGVDTIKLRDSNSQLVDTVYQASGYDIYEMEIVSGEEYTISFYDRGIILCYEQTFTSAGDHVIIDFDRCNWVWPPSPWGPPIIIYIYAGYDYNILVFKDEHGNFIENSQLAIYDKTDNQYLQRWTDVAEGYTLLGARFDTDHTVQLMLRTFDGVFTLDTTFPANGSAIVGEEDIITTNWTVPIKYNLDVLPVDIYGASIFDVFCGLSEYTPLDPGAFWGMDLSDQGYVPVTNCSGFSMCDIIAEKDGYTDYNETALNWTSKSAMVKDYRHNIVMEEE